MKKTTKVQLDKALKRLLDSGKVVIGKIQVTDGEKISRYAALSACPDEHREGYRRALETGRDVYLRDVVYAPVFVATIYTTSGATLE